ncbi:hypothetical protein FNU79_10535 [Deinococcus detaillensis]|uniref:DUF1795 domain-containing protein n=1 Tax=Deinococcus detaillensis TaxID=2592048 RepID=A0A553UWT2_9DEIO|nr:hypothetical protein [Deinococcus detaillensis]TSA84662.1 hypothetical protein FNU79_10535 [Deinococcus detaillensis]
MIRLLSLPISCFLLALSSGLAAPLSDSAAPFQVNVPDSWVQRPYPNHLPGMLVIAPGTPPPVVLQFFYAPHKGKQNDTKMLADFIGGVEESMSGDGRGSVKQLSTRPLDVDGIKGTERQYDLTLKANGVTVRTKIWYGVSAKNLLSFQVTIGTAATPAQAAAFDKALKTVKFKR